LTISVYSGTPPGGYTYAAGTLYYTIDGNDPRASTGAVSASGQVYSSPITLNTSTIVKARLKNGTVWSPVTTAVFIVNAVAANAANLVVSELHYAPLGPSAAEATAGFNSGNDFEYLELLNVGAQNVDLSNVIVSDAVEFNFANANPNTLTVPPGGRVVIVGNQAAFLYRYGNNAQVKIAGVFDGNLSNGGEMLTVRAANNAIIAQFTWGELEPWPVAADGAGYSMVLNNPSPNPAYGAGGSWRPSAAIGGAAGMPDSTPFAGNPNADDDDDGLSNFLEYGSRTNPEDPTSRTAPAIAISLYSVNGITQSYLRVQFRRNLAAECNYAVLLSENALNWQTGESAVTYVGTQHNGDGSATVTYRSTQPCDPDHRQMLVRLRVSQ
jgi:hypothetical protein